MTEYRVFEVTTSWHDLWSEVHKVRIEGLGYNHKLVCKGRSNGKLYAVTDVVDAKPVDTMDEAVAQLVRDHKAKERKQARKRSAENGILQQLFREAKAQGMAVAIHDGYGDDYLSEFRGRESDFIEASREVEDVAVRVKMPDGEVHWLAWIVWGNAPHEMFADYNSNLFEQLFPGTVAKIEKSEELSY